MSMVFNGTTVKKNLQSYARTLHIEALGVAPFPLLPKTTATDTNFSPCPFATGDAETSLTAGSQNMALCRAIVALFPYAVPSYRGTIQLARYTWSLDYHVLVRQCLEQLRDFLATSFPEAFFEIHVDTSPLADRHAAYLAGLGIIGKNHCLIHPVYGSYVAIGTLLTSLPLPIDTPMQGQCLGCDRCRKACPGQCLSGEVFQWATCKSYLTQKKGDLSQEERAIIRKTPLVFGCDVCQEVCPHNAQIPETPFPEWRNIAPTLSIEALRHMTNREFKAQYGHRAFSWRGKAILLRNYDYITKEFSPHTDTSPY